MGFFVFSFPLFHAKINFRPTVELTLRIYRLIERGLRSPTLDTLFKIAYALDIPPHEIIKTIEAETLS
jgi:transcriptional regulator with XRE-family HTH domain